MHRHRRTSFFFLRPFPISILSGNRGPHRYVAFDDALATIRRMDVYLFPPPFPDHVIRGDPGLKKMACRSRFLRTCDNDLERVVGLREFDAGPERDMRGQRHSQLLEKTRDRDHGDARIGGLLCFELRSLDSRALGPRNGRYGV